LLEDLQAWALPDGVSADAANFTQLARAYKKINAPVGDLGLASLRISTRALAGDDDTYADLESKLSGITSARNILADQMSTLLQDAEFGKKQISGKDATTLVRQSNELLEYVEDLAGDHHN
jgi:hypothetical protein